VRTLAYAAALALFAPDAQAWGLETHLFFAQWLLAALPFADRDLRNAALRLPGLVLAGACLPDLALAGKALGTPAFRRAHHWSTLRRIAAAPRSDADRALVIGYASHLVSDVIAHNHFVPEHEARIARVRHVTHAIAEFAMDEHIRRSLTTSPTHALFAAHLPAVDFVARGFPCGESLATRALTLLSRADKALRASRLPRLCRRTVDCFYRDPAYRFDRYIEAVKHELGGIEGALAGRFVDWISLDAEGRASDAGAERCAGQHVARVMQPEHDA
jgi:hypothetical protein